jgi:hypothetical protein
VYAGSLRRCAYRVRVLLWRVHPETKTPARGRGQSVDFPENIRFCFSRITTSY